MKKKNIFWGIFILCLTIIFIAPIQSRATVDPIGIYLDEKGEPSVGEISRLDWTFLNLRVDLMMSTPEFPGVSISYDKIGFHGEQMEKYVSLQTRRKIVVYIRDTRGFYASIATKSELLEYLNGFWAHLEISLFGITNNFDNDVVIYIIPREGLEKGSLLGYFYQGKFVILKDFK